MFTNSWRVCCVVIAAFACVPVMVARSQDDPFGGFDRNPAAGEAAAAPASVPGESPANEKPVLGTELPARVGGGQEFCRCVGETNPAAAAHIEKALRGSLKSNGLDFTDSPLEEVANYLQEEYGIPIQIDAVSLEESGLDPSEPVTINLHNTSLQSALRIMLKRLGLTYLIQHEVLKITTPEVAEAQLVTCVYDVRGLVEKPEMPNGASAWADFDPLREAITSCISQETWKENGKGEAEIRSLQPGLFVISQTRAIHDDIRGLLETIREMRRTPVAAGGPSAAAAVPNDNETVTRSYLLQIEQSGDAEKLRKELRELIVQSLPDEQWDGRLPNRQPVVLTILADRIVLRHNPSTHKALQKVLVDGGVAMPANSGEASGHHAAGGFGGGGGGFFSPRD